MTDDERPHHPHDERNDVDDEHDREASEGEELADDAHDPNGARIGGLPQAVWAAQRLGAQPFAVCADITNADRITFWLCVELDASRWSAVEILAIRERAESPVAVPTCWLMAARAKIPLLVNPPEGNYTIEGIDA